MLYVNDVLLKEEIPQWKKYEDFLKNELPHLEDTVIFKRSTPIRVNMIGPGKPGLVEPLPIMFVPFEALDFDEEYGSEHWRYTRSAPTKDTSGKFHYKPLGMNFRQSESFDKKRQPDLIFFMMKLSHQVKGGAIILEDKKKEARKVIERDDREIAVKYQIYNMDSPLSPHNTGSEDMLRMIASAWGVSKAHSKKKSLDEVRVELFSAVDKGQRELDKTGRGFDIFLSEIKSKERLVLRANIQRAFDNRTIVYNQTEFTWKYAENDHLITTISTRFFNNPISGLFDYFIRNEGKRRIFYNTLDDRYTYKEPEVDEGNEGDQDKNLEDLSWMELKNEAVLAGVKWYGKKKPEIIEEIRKKKELQTQ